VGYGLVTVLLALAVIFGLLLVASVVVGVLRDGESLLYGGTMRVPAQISPQDIGALPAGIEMDTWPDVSVEIDPTVHQMLLRSASDLASLILLLAGLWLLRGFLRSVLDGDPFGAGNVRRLRSIGLLLVVGAPVLELVTYSLRQAMFNTLPPYPSIDLGVEGLFIPGNALLGGLAAFILAAVFAYGLRLREDVEATI
jgi:hypothetical protein